MIVQVQDILKDALDLAGAIEIDETPSSTEFAVALRAANMMIDYWSSQRLLILSTTPINVTLTAGKPVYTIGSVGADFLYPAPTRIYSAYYTDVSGIDNPIEIIDTTTYNNFPDKHISRGPTEYLAYDQGLTQQASRVGTLSFYASPDFAYGVHLEADSVLTEFVNYTDTVNFEPAYYEPLVYNLGLRLFRRYNDAKIPIPADIVRIAGEGLSNLKSQNSVQIVAGLELPGKVSPYNIYNDTY